MFADARLFELNKVLKNLREQGISFDSKVYVVEDLNKDRSLIDEAIEDIKNLMLCIFTFMILAKT